MFQKLKKIAWLIPLTALCIIAPVNGTKTKAAEENQSYTVTIPTDVSINQETRSGDLTVKAELNPHTELNISIESKNNYQLECNNKYGLSYILKNKDNEEQVNNISFSTKDSDSKASFTKELETKLKDDAVAKVSGTYEDRLSFNISCTRYYKVTLDLGTYGTMANENHYKMVVAGATYGNLPIPNSNDPEYYFEGWYINPAEHRNNSSTVETKVNENDVVDNDITIHAHWAYGWTVKYDPNGGIGTMEDTHHGWYTNVHVTKNVFKKEGYSFGGWYMSRQNEGKTEWSYGRGDAGWVDPNHWYVEGTPQTEGLKKYILPDGNVLQGCTYIHDDVITLHAIWNPNTYSIQYDANGGTGTMDSDHVRYGIDVKLKTNKYSKADSVFAGWNTKADGTGILYQNEAVVKNLISSNGDKIILYAQWKTSSQNSSVESKSVVNTTMEEKKNSDDQQINTSSEEKQDALKNLTETEQESEEVSE